MIFTTIGCDDHIFGGAAKIKASAANYTKTN